MTDYFQELLLYFSLVSVTVGIPLMIYSNKKEKEYLEKIKKQRQKERQDWDEYLSKQICPKCKTKMHLVYEADTRETRDVMRKENSRTFVFEKEAVGDLKHTYKCNSCGKLQTYKLNFSSSGIPFYSGH